MTARILVVCTGNICRSPVVERALAAALDERGIDAVVRSAGTHGGLPNDPVTVRAAAAHGIDLGHHRSRRLTRAIVDHDGADLIITMTRRHLRTVVGGDAELLARTFTLRELARRAAQVAPAADMAAWRSALGAGRSATELLADDPADDLDDPHGRAAREHERMVRSVRELVAVIAARWPAPA